MKKIGEIKDEFTAAKEADWQSMCNQYREDSRSGVQKLILQYEKKIKALEAEKLRMEQMMQYEHKYEHLGYLCVIDEVGRGPLAGPVVACAVILPANHQILYLNDSKKLTAHKREELYDVILREAVAVGIGMVGPAIPQVPIIKGDAKSASIAAASIVAKVTRDRLMVEYDKTLPGYGFASNKGYGSTEHIEALKKFGPTPIHRTTFIKNFV